MDDLEGLGGQGFSGLQSILGSINPKISEAPSAPKIETLAAKVESNLRAEEPASVKSSPDETTKVQSVTPPTNEFLKPIMDAQVAIQETLADLKKTTTASQAVLKQVSDQITLIFQASQATVKGKGTEAQTSTQTAGARRKQSRRPVGRKGRMTRRLRLR
jgi:hypothetical protein